MRRFLAVVPFLLLAACGGGGLAPLPTDEARAMFRRGGLAEVIEVRAASRLPLRQAELVAPDGSTTDAQSVVAERGPNYGEDQRRGNEVGRGSAYGIGGVSDDRPPVLPMGLGASSGTQAVFLTMISTAEIPLGDEVAYRRDWQSYRVRLHFGDAPGEVQTRELLAPEPREAQ